MDIHLVDALLYICTTGDLMVEEIPRGGGAFEKKQYESSVGCNRRILDFRRMYIITLCRMHARF